MSHFYPWLNFAILFLGLAIILNRVLGAQFKKQREELAEKMKSASKEYDFMKTQFEEARALSASLNSRIEELKFNASREVQLETKKMEFEAERFVEKIFSDADLKMKAEVLSMKAALEKDLLSQSMNAARQVLERDFKNTDADWTENMLGQEGGVNEGRKNYAS